jgi:3',5'-cyclic AMP phosphodiesterase CpdA
VLRPFLLAQLSDPHIGAEWFDDQSVGRLATAVESVRAVRPQPDAVLLSGDLADHATDEEYERLRELVAPLGAPLYVLPGNHDDRRALHRNFGVPGGDGEPARYSVDLGPLRLVVLDTTRPGEDSGALELVHARPRLFSPGTGWSYLGLIVEETTGATLRDELRRRIRRGLPRCKTRARWSC